jgi:hypothetical protein
LEAWLEWIYEKLIDIKLCISSMYWLD